MIEDNRPICFLLDETGVDVSSAELFGRIVEIPKQSIAGDLPDPWHPDYGSYLVRIVQELGYEPSRDFFILSGRVHVQVVAVACLCEYFGSVDLLVYSPKSKRYFHRKLATLAIDPNETELETIESKT